MKLINTKSILLAVVATVFTVSSVQSEARQPRRERPVSAERVIDMSYDIADRLDLEARNLSRRELKLIKDKLQDVRNIINGLGDIGDISGPTEYTAVCTTVSTDSFGRVTTRVAGERVGSIKKIASDCKYLASQMRNSTSIRLSELTITKLGDAVESATCTIKKTDSFGRVTTSKMGTIAASSLQGLQGECGLLAKEIFGQSGKATLSNISSL